MGSATAVENAKVSKRTKREQRTAALLLAQQVVEDLFFLTLCSLNCAGRTVDPKVFGNGRICQQVLQTSDQLQHPRGLVAATNTGVPSIRRVNATRDFERTLAWFP